MKENRSSQMMKYSSLFLCSLTMNVSGANNTDAKHPNLLYIFPDQYRQMALSIWSNPAYKNALRVAGDPVLTPNLDKLAQQGVLFTDACSTHPVSSPHRAMLMSGMYPHYNGIEDVNCFKGKPQGLYNDIECFTDVLAKVGYETAYVGKTHWEKNEALFDKEGNYVGTTQDPGGNYMNAYDTFIPAGKGRHSNKYWFQQFTNGSHFNTKCYSNRPELVNGNKDGQIYQPKRFTVDIESEIVVQYLENKNHQRDASKPFSLIWSINPPHSPYSRESDCKKEVFEKFFKNMAMEQLLNRANVSTTVSKTIPASKDDSDWKSQEQLELTTRVYFSLIKSIDDEIGKVLQTLDKEGLSDNTLVVFTSDHGEMMGSHGLRGKNQIFEESFVVPFIIRYPGKLKPQVNNLMFGSVDIMPTMLGLMGFADNIPTTVQGVNYSNGLLTGSFKKGEKPETALYLNLGRKGVRSYQYTYVVHKNGDYNLYDNNKDPYQMHSLKLNEIPTDKAAALKKALGTWLAKAGDSWATNKMHSDLITY